MPINFNANNVQPTVNTNTKPETAEKKPEEKTITTKEAVAIGVGAAALGALGMYIAKGKGGNAVKDAAEKIANENGVKDAGNEVSAEAQKLEILPSRKEALEKLGIRKNEYGRLVTGEGEDAHVFSGTNKYTVAPGRNVIEYIDMGRVSSRTILRDGEEPIKKHYKYYGNDKLRSVTTEKNGKKTEVLRNQTAIRAYKEALHYEPKTKEEIAALKKQGIKYEVVQEPVTFDPPNDCYNRVHMKEVYTYPESSPIKTKEVFWGTRDSLYSSSDLHEGKEITLTFREPVQTDNPNYKADKFSMRADTFGFSTGRVDNSRRFVDVEDTRILEDYRSCIPFSESGCGKNTNKAINEAIEADLPMSALRKIMRDE